MQHTRQRAAESFGSEPYHWQAGRGVTVADTSSQQIDQVGVASIPIGVEPTTTLNGGYARLSGKTTMS